MHRHHRYARAIATGYGEVRLQIPVFRCGQCRRMTGGMTLLGQEMRYQRKDGHGRDGLCGRRLVRRVTGARKRCPKDCVTWDGTGGASDDVAIGESQPGVAAVGEVEGEVWTEHNVLALLPEQGLSNQTT